MQPQQEQEKIYQAAICFIIQTERDIARKSKFAFNFIF